jgi:HSP20 family molecular chaperone IbpA
MRDNYTPEKLINDVFRNFIGLENLLETATRTVTFPKYEILKNKETKEQLLRVLLAGYKKSDIVVQRANGTLVIKHEKSPEDETENVSGFEPFGQTYIAKRAFKLEFKLNANVKIKNVTFEDGILNVLFNIVEDQEVENIEIN